MKKIIPLLCLLFCTVSLHAQEATTKQIVYVNNFTGTNYASGHDIAGIESNVIRGLVESNRVLVRDFNSDEEFKRELRERTADANVSEKDYAFQMLSERGAKWVIDGVVTHYNSVYKRNDEGYGFYDAKIDVALQVTDVATGLVTMTKTISSDQTLTGIFTERGTTIGNTAREALANASEILIIRARSFAEECFRLGGCILEIDEVDDDEAETVYINMGSGTGVKKGDIFEVFETKIVSARTIKKKIGEIKVTEVQGADISLCKVKKGGDVILRKMQTMEDGEKLTIRSRMKKKPLGGLI